MTEKEEKLNKQMQEAEQKREKCIEDLKNKLSGLKPGRASPDLLNSIKVDIDGRLLPLKTMANISAIGPYSLVVLLWDKKNLPAAVTAIKTSGLALNPVSSDDGTIKISLPYFSEEKRIEYTKKAASLAEDAKITIRKIREGLLNQFKEMLKSKQLSEDEFKRSSNKVQKQNDESINDIAEILKKAQKEIMTNCLLAI